MGGGAETIPRGQREWLPWAHTSASLWWAWCRSVLDLLGNSLLEADNPGGELANSCPACATPTLPGVQALVLLGFLHRAAKPPLVPAAGLLFG